MFSSSDNSYKQARSIKKGEHTLHAKYQELVDWVSKEFNVNALDFTCETKETSMGYKQQVIRIHVETIEEARKLDTNRSHEPKIIDKFMNFLLLGHKQVSTPDKLKTDIWKVSPFPEIIIGYYALEEVERSIAMAKAWPAHKALSDKYASFIWCVSCPTQGSQYLDVFLHTDKQREEFAMTGTAKAFENDLLEELKKYDDFGYFGRHSIHIRYDNKESFDKDYGGNWYYYYK